MAALLTYEHVTISYNGRPAVRDVSFSLHSGEILGLVGESGSGKSTLLRAAMGLNVPGEERQGRIILHREEQFIPSDHSFSRMICGKRKECGTEDEIDLGGLTEREYREIRGPAIGMIFQDAGASFCPVRTIGSQFLESMRAHSRIRKKEAMGEALSLLEKLNFSDPEKIWKSYPFELSGGMNQRVGIAMAMLLKPAALLADEPTSALDSVSTKQVVEEIRNVRRFFGTAVLLVTHDISLAAALTDRIAVLRNGTIVEFGETQEVISHPKELYTRQMMEAVPRLI